MANAKISALTALTGANVDTAADVLGIVDTDLTQTKKIVVDELRIALGIATQAQQEAGSSNVVFVTPGRQHFHPSAAKAWGKFAGATGTLAASHNVTSVVRDSLGDYTVTLATDFGTADYVIALTPLNGSVSILRVSAQAAGTFSIKSVGFDFNDNDPTAIFFACFGDFA